MGIVLIHPDLPQKLAVLSDGAYRLYMEALLWSAHQRTHGVVLAEELIQVSRNRRRNVYAREVVERGRWRFEPGRFVIVDFIDVIRRGGTRPRIPDAVKGRVLARDHHRCVACGTSRRLSIDHRVPWSRFGSDDESNLQTLCIPCNSIKGARD